MCKLTILFLGLFLQTDVMAESLAQISTELGRLQPKLNELAPDSREALDNLNQSTVTVLGTLHSGTDAEVDYASSGWLTTYLATKNARVTLEQMIASLGPTLMSSLAQLPPEILKNMGEKFMASVNRFGGRSKVYGVATQVTSTVPAVQPFIIDRK